MNNFTIDKVGWYKGKALNQDIPLRFKTLASFLQNNGLTVKPLLAEDAQVDDEFSISSSDLTPEGLQLMRKAYPRWVGAIDRGKSVTDTMLLEKELAKLRST